MRVTVETTEGGLSFEAPTIEVARLVAAAHGFHVDVEPMEPGKVKITATSNGATFSSNGSSVNDAAAKLITRLSHES